MGSGKAFILAAFFCTGLVLPPFAAVLAAEPAKPVFTADFSGKNFIFESEADAKKGLRDKLMDAMEQKLSEYGYSGGDMAAMLEGMKITSQKIEEKKVDIAVDGKVRRVKVFDLSGSASITLGPEEVNRLYLTLCGLSITGNESIERYRGYLAKFLTLKPEPNQVQELKYRLAKAWLPEARAQMKPALSARDADLDSYMKSAAEALALAVLFAAETGDEAGAKILRTDIDSLTLKYFQTSKVDAATAPRMLAAAGMLTRLSAGTGFDTGSKATQVLEFNWRQHVLEIDGQGAAGLALLESETDAFARLFPASKFLPDLLKRLEAAEVKFLLAPASDDGQTFIVLTEAYRNFLSRFPASKSIPAISQAIVAKCGAVLPGIEARNDDEYKALTRCWELCFEVTRGKALYDLLKTAQPEFIGANRTRIEKELLGSLGFFLYWDMAVQDMKFGMARQSFPGGGKAAELWEGGENAAQCICRSSAEDLCRHVYFSGEYYEVAVKFGPKGLYEVELCNFNMPPSKRAFVYQTLRDRYMPLHGKAEGERFLNGISGDELEFSAMGGKKHRAAVSASGEKGSIRFFSVELAPVGSEAHAAPAPKRQVPVFKKGECVRWDCDIECRYEGKVKERKGSEYLVTIKKTPRSIERDMNVRKDAESLQGCED